MRRGVRRLPIARASSRLGAKRPAVVLGGEVGGIDDRRRVGGRPGNADGAAAGRMGDAAHQRIGAADFGPLEPLRHDRKHHAGDDAIGRARRPGRIVAVQIHQRFRMLQPRRRHRAPRRKDETRQQMVVQVPSDAGQRDPTGYSGRLQHLRLADAGAHQQERRSDRRPTRRRPCPALIACDGAVAPDLDPDDTAALDPSAVRRRSL